MASTFPCVALLAETKRIATPLSEAGGRVPDRSVRPKYLRRYKSREDVRDRGTRSPARWHSDDSDFERKPLARKEVSFRERRGGRHSSETENDGPAFDSKDSAGSSSQEQEAGGRVPDRSVRPKYLWRYKSREDLRDRGTRSPARWHSDDSDFERKPLARKEVSFRERRGGRHSSETENDGPAFDSKDSAGSSSQEQEAGGRVPDRSVRPKYLWRYKSREDLRDRGTRSPARWHSDDNDFGERKPLARKEMSFRERRGGRHSSETEDDDPAFDPQDSAGYSSMKQEAGARLSVRPKNWQHEPREDVRYAAKRTPRSRDQDDSDLENQRLRNTKENISDPRRDRNFRKMEQDDPAFKPHELAKYLADHGFKAPMNDLESEFSSSHLVRALEENTHIFGMDKGAVVLQPEIKICYSYTEDRGCRERLQCVDIHICPEFLSGDCEMASCEMGHKWDTTHNKRVLRTLYLDGLNPSQILSLINLDDVIETSSWTTNSS
ncbi:uncharacterized protein LOC125034063 [Penaeus chinensis]|uniref:uncharacterized protein LOC125034063 n=1 Tax=Penaeus chinensis TaxID=139456 RepID=UPI001FB74886|nr:uncharacterized protein LOC125034063 [Penaeus chinensis]